MHKLIAFMLSFFMIIFSSTAIAVEHQKILQSNADHLRLNIQKKLAYARNNKDIIKASCLNDNLNKINSLIKDIKDNQIQSDIVMTKISQIEFDSNRCIGVTSLASKDYLDIKSTIDLNIDQDDTIISDMLSALPACSSCFK